MYETYTRYILTAWFSGRRNASLSLPISLSTTIFLLYFSCSTQPVRSNHLRGKVTRENLPPPPPPPLRNFAPARFLLRSTKKKRLYFFSNENSYSLNSILTRHFTIRCEWSTICVPFLSWGKTRGIAIWRNYFALWRALSLSLTIIFIHIPRIFSFREERERIKNNWNNKIISIRAHTRFVKVQRL